MMKPAIPAQYEEMLDSPVLDAGEHSLKINDKEFNTWCSQWRTLEVKLDILLTNVGWVPALRVSELGSIVDLTYLSTSKYHTLSSQKQSPRYLK